MIVVAVLVMIAGAANAVMDKLQFHYNKSIFRNLPSWNPDESWKNKWKLNDEGDPIPGKERFPLSSTALVFLTDAWHFFQFVMLSSFTVAIIIYAPEVWRASQLLPSTPFWNTLLLTIIEFAAMKILFGVTFEFFYSKVFHAGNTGQSFYSGVLNNLKDAEKFEEYFANKYKGMKSNRITIEEVEQTWDKLGEILVEDFETFVLKEPRESHFHHIDGGAINTEGFIITTNNPEPITIDMKQPTNTVPVTPANSVIKPVNMDIAKRTPGSVLRDIECYSANVSELAKELRIELIDPATDQFKPVTLEFAVATINTTVAKFKETMAECEGKDDFSFTLPDGTVGTVVNIVLELLGIDL